MYIVKTPNIVQPIVSDLLWTVHTFDDVVYLTFDDGPTPEVTERTLDLLKSYNAKATFFCLGKNVEAHPELYARIQSEGHTIGNHTFDHPNGRKSNHYHYLKNVVRAERFITSAYFRPPYGQITRAQIQALKKRYRIVMWDIITGDFDLNVTPERIVKNVMDNVQSGSIIVMHDSLKAAPRMLPALETILPLLHNQGYRFDALPMTAAE